jgi:hypothetical protein
VIKIPKLRKSDSRRPSKTWIFLPGIGSPGKARNNGIQEVVGSIPIGSTKQIKKAQLGFFRFGTLRGATESTALTCP